MNQPTDKLEVCPLSRGDIPEVLEIERMCFIDPWTIESFRGIINNNLYTSIGVFKENPHARVSFANPTPRKMEISDSRSCDPVIYKVKLLGYLIALQKVDELHILNIAVKPENRRKGLGGLLLDSILHRLGSRIKVALLEVRVSNSQAISFYTKRGFRSIGRRKRYYPNGEDALLMALHLDSQQS